jgi:hypothetical protein
VQARCLAWALDHGVTDGVWEAPRRTSGAPSGACPLQTARLVNYGFIWQGGSYEDLTYNVTEYLTDAGGTATNSDCTKASLDSAAVVKAVTFMCSPITTEVSPAAVKAFQVLVTPGPSEGSSPNRGQLCG